MVNATLQRFCGEFSCLVRSGMTQGEMIEAGKPMVAELSKDGDWFRDVIGYMLLDRAFLERQRPGIWPNEITIHRDPEGAFVVMAYIWDPREADTIHDHGSWGIVAPCIGCVRETKYRRRDDGTKEGYAELVEILDHRLYPGVTTYVLPMDEGIHCMENPCERPAVTVNVYGPTIRKGYIRFFDMGSKEVWPVYPPRAAKEVLLVRTLAAVGGEKGREVLGEAMKRGIPAYLMPEYLRALGENP